MKKVYFFILCMCFFTLFKSLFLPVQKVYGMNDFYCLKDRNKVGYEYGTDYGYNSNDDLYDGYNFDGIDNIVKESSGGQFCFKDILTRLFSGEKGVLHNGYELIRDSVCSQFDENKNNVMKIIVLALSMALLSNILVIFSTNNYWETGFFVLYLILVNSLMISFISLVNIGKELINSVVRFMECLVPSFFLAVGISNGYSTSTGLCAITLTVITIIEKVIINILLPAISIYVAISLVTSIQKDNNASKIGDIIANFVEWGTKSLLALVLGMNVVESMILPLADKVKNKGITQAVSMIPVVGNGLSGAANLMLSSGEIIKNSIGGAALVAIIIVVAVPITKLLIFIAIYKVVAAIIEPVSDRHVVAAIEIVTKAAGLLYKVCISSVIMLGASIAIICLFTRG